jgi:putative methyltransferase (TIGR04325 family)
MSMINKFLLSDYFNKINKFFARKLFKIFKIFFVETKLLSLPKNNYPTETRLLEELQRKYPDDVNYKPYISYPGLLDLLITIKKIDQNLKFCDYGAGNLNLFYYLNKNFKNLDFFFYDQEKVGEIVESYKKEKNLENLFVNKPVKNMNFDLVYFGSSLQYLNNYETIIKSFFNTKYILIAQTPFFVQPFNISKIVLKQINMHPKINYLYMFNLNDFINFMKNSNFNLINKSLNNVTKFMNFKNFDSRYKDLEMYDLLFEKSIK